VGLVSPDLRRHPVAFFLLPVLEALDQERYPITCYANSPVEDEVTAWLQALARRWRRTASLDDAQMAAQIRADGIDLLIDLAGHTAGNRLTVFARRPAPVQATWLGYELTTGLTAMDYLLSDTHSLPPGCEAFFTEEVVRLPGGHLCFRPPDYAPEVTPLPCLVLGGFTLGCFNNPAKINREVARLWARVLEAIPRARLVVGYKTLRHRREQEVMRRRLAEAGMDPTRLEVAGWEDHARALAAYQAVDLALDPFPHGGTTTTFEALWMGVPVLTLPGDSPVSRLSVAPLRELGLDELETTSPDQYVATAVALARAPQRLAAWRAELRQRMAASSLCRGEALARRLEEAWREMWRRWCAGQRR
jgi:predicted O-linked N-acetylglucosamine transferase (SPINDLY family)